MTPPRRLEVICQLLRLPVSSLLASPYDVESDSSIDNDSTEPDGFLYTALKALPSSSCELIY